MQYEIMREAIMARGGINKALVQKARDALLSRDINPSIDAIRGELGNTGSKTTIHRYLKELETEESTHLSDEALLSETLKNMVASIASQLQQEAKCLIEDKEEHYLKEKNALQKQNNDLTQAFKNLEEENSSLAEALHKKSDSLLSVEDKLRTTQSNELRLEQQVSDLEALLSEKSGHIASLEEKHQHSRDALEHFRKSAKDQREQELHRHEQQVQELQAECRQLNQTLSLKQTEITQTSKDNARLASEVGEAHKRIASLETQKRDLENSHMSNLDKFHVASKDLGVTEAKVNQLAQELASIKTKNTDLIAERESLLLKVNSLETELSIKTKIYQESLADQSSETKER